MGYMANPDLGEEHLEEMRKKNAETFTADGWLLSGDKACVDKYGMFRITGRYKELLITAGGENVAPVPIEDWIKSTYTAISNVMMYLHFFQLSAELRHIGYLYLVETFPE